MKKLIIFYKTKLMTKVDNQCIMKAKELNNSKKEVNYGKISN